MNEAQMHDVEAAQSEPDAEQAGGDETQSAAQQLAETRAALRKCLADLIGTSVLTWR